MEFTLSRSLAGLKDKPVGFLSFSFMMKAVVIVYPVKNNYSISDI